MINWSPDFVKLNPLWMPEAIKRTIMHTLWVPVDEALPELDKWVLVCRDDGEIFICRRIIGGYGQSVYEMDDEERCQMAEDIVAWMQLPEPWRRM